MTTQFNNKVSQILAFSREEAARLSCAHVAPEHLLLGMMRSSDGIIAKVFQKFNVSQEALKTQIEEKLQRTENVFPPVQSSELMLNENASNILKLAVLEARQQHQQTIDEHHLLLAILHDRTDNTAKQLLEERHIDYNNVLNLTKETQPQPQNALQLPEEDEEEYDSTKANASGHTTQTATNDKEEKSKTPVLDNFSTDLTQAALDGKLDPCVGREQEIQRVMEILGRRKKNNPILIGEPGVGKSAIVEGLAQLIAHRKCSPMFFNRRIVSLDMTGVVAGTKYRGQFEERIRALIKEIEQNPQIIVFIDEIHTIIGAGSTPGSMDAANIMKPALARGTIQCIGATTLDEYRNSIEKDGALERRFQKVIVDPTTAEQTLQILHNLKDRYEKHHHVEFTDDAIMACVRLTERYVTDRSQPDKAIDAMDETGARVHLKNAQIPPEIHDLEKQIAEAKNNKNEAVKNQNYELAASYRDRQAALEKQLSNTQAEWMKGNNEQRQTVTEAEVSDVVSMMTGIPVQRMAENEGQRLKDMAPTLKASVIAQDAAIDKMVKPSSAIVWDSRPPIIPLVLLCSLAPQVLEKPI